MNYKLIFKTLGKLLLLEAILLTIPLIASFLNKENIYHAYLIPIIILLAIFFLTTLIKSTNNKFYPKEGFFVVGLTWIVLSLFGSLPFIISQTIPNFFSAFFEAASGFTTTGATIIDDVEAIYKSILLWRSLMVWIGGMGVLVFVIAILPQTSSRSIYLIKAESTGPSVGKLTSKTTLSARILYLIYISLTVILFLLLLIKIPFFDSINYALSTAGTGGFAIHNNSIAHYNSTYVEIVITIFMILFGINFNVFYLILIGNIRKALKSEELKVYLLILFSAIILIAINTLTLYNNIFTSLRYSAFQSASIMSTSGFSSTNFDMWPEFSKWILIILMFIGSSAGSTAGGIKVSRIIIYFKSVLKEIKYTIHPKQVSIITFEDKPITESVSKGAFSYITAYFIILILGILLISVDNYDFTTNFTAALSSISNVGPGFNLVGPLNNYSMFSSFSKTILALIMITGRLELFPILIFLSPKLYTNH